MAKYTRQGRATGVPMHYVYRHPKGGVPRSRPNTLSREANLRLTILDYSQRHTVAATCRHFGIARSTFYRWKERYVPSRLATLENRSSRPRRPTWTTGQVMAVRDLRAQYPRMGKDRVAILLAQETNALRSDLHGFQQLYNHVRPHQALGYRTPAAVLAASGYL